MRTVPIPALLFFVASLTTAVLLPAVGQPPAAATKKQRVPTFRVNIEYVEVDAVAHDKQGRFVADLKKPDFEVFEDGKRQEIVSFELVNVPVEAPSLPPLLTGRRLEPDVVSNVQPLGRVYLIALDDLHIDPKRTALARRVARQFIESTVAPIDLAAVTLTSGARTASQDFTGSKRLLLEAVDRVLGRKVVSPGLVAAGGSDSTPATPRERIFNARWSLETLAQLATFAGTIHSRRKAIVLVSEGIDYDLGDQGFDFANRSIEDQTSRTGQTPPRGLVDEAGSSRALRDDLKRFVDAANRGNVTLYALDPRVYTQVGDDLVDIRSSKPRFTDAAGNETSTLGPLLDDLKASQDNLSVMATETGGFAATGSPKAVASAFERIRDENSRYYILGYYPTNDKNDGKFRKIDVAVKRPDVVLIARKGYVATKDKVASAATVETKEGTSAPLREALGAAVPTIGLPISVVAVPFRGSDRNASVLVMVQTPPGAVKFVEKEGKTHGKLEVGVVAMDYQNKTRGGERLDLDMPLKAETAAAVERAGLLVQSRITVPPGRYVLRVGARDVIGDRVGAVHCDLEIPDYAKAPVSMSGLVISSAHTALANPRPDNALTTTLPGSPAVIRNFTQDDEIGVLVEIYDTKMSTPHDIDVVTTVIGENGREVYRRDEKRSTADVKGMRGGSRYELKVPLASLAPGWYVLRVEAWSHLDANNPVARETTFRVVGM